MNTTQINNQTKLEINAMLKYGVFYEDPTGKKKYLCDGGISSMDMLIGLLGFPIELFENYETEMVLNGIKSSINDHIESGRLKEKELTQLAA